MAIVGHLDTQIQFHTDDKEASAAGPSSDSVSSPRPLESVFCRRLQMTKRLRNTGGQRAVYGCDFALVLLLCMT